MQAGQQRQRWMHDLLLGHSGGDQLAIEGYGCLEFTSVREGHLELAISYWNTLEQIGLWKQNTEHQAAQERGKSKWYQSYQVQVVEIVSEYCEGA